MSNRAVIRASAFMGEDGCEHQEFIQPISIIHGTGPDEGTVTIRVGECIVSFESAEALIEGLQREAPMTALPRVSPARAGLVAVLAGLAGLISTIGGSLPG